MNKDLIGIIIFILVLVCLFLILYFLGNSLKNKYRKSGYFFAIAVSLIYQPILLSIENFSPIINFLIGGMIFSLLNYFYILLTEKSSIKYLNVILLPTVNFAVMLFIFPKILSSFSIHTEGNCAAFGLVFFFIPWIIIVITAGIIHIKSMKNYV